MTAELVGQQCAPVRLGAQVPSWPVPVEAVGEWVSLQVAIAAHGGRLACETDPEAWFASAASAARAAAVEACGWCPVRGECLAYAVAAEERDGIWGGSTPEERRVLAGRLR